MTIYYHPKTCGFYDTRVHGERTVRIHESGINLPENLVDGVDGVLPQAKEPRALLGTSTVEILNPQCLLPMEQELIEVSQFEYDLLIEAQGRGEVISLQDGRPMAKLPEFKEADLLAGERIWRDKTLNNVLWLNERHRDELYLKRETTLSDAEFYSFLEYLQRLREWPQSDDFPSPEKRPAPPAWINEQFLKS